MLTSRILLALSAVQLFIERVIRNLEPLVAAADIDASQWEWMKRYRVWQANREVFLWPENWLYPELRDDQSPFFQQMMSSLLQGDITDDAAASAYLSYLTSLEEVAKLEPCGLYYQPGTADTDETSYVVARTAGAHRKYYFRELSSGSLDAMGAGPDRVRGHADNADRLERPAVPVLAQGLEAEYSRTRHRSARLASDGSSNVVANMPVSDLNNYPAAAGECGRQWLGSRRRRLVLDGVLQRRLAARQDIRCQQPDVPRTNSTRAVLAHSRHTGTSSRIVPAQYQGTNPLVQQWDMQGQLAVLGNALMLAITVPGRDTRQRLHPAQYAQPSGALRRPDADRVPARQVGRVLPVTFSEVLDLPSSSQIVHAGDGPLQRHEQQRHLRHQLPDRPRQPAQLFEPRPAVQLDATAGGARSQG